MRAPQNFHMHSVSMASYRILIIGGGLAGLTTALALQKAGHHAVILERVSKFPNVGGSIHLPPNACRALESVGVLGEIMKTQELIFLPQHISLLTYKTGEVLNRMNLVPDMKLRYGLPYLSVQRISLHKCLLKAAVDAGAIVELGCAIESVDFDTATLHLKDSRAIEGDLIVGADGENSQCRPLFLGRPDPPSHFGHSIFSCQIPLSVVREAQPDLGYLVDDPGALWWLGPGTMAIATVSRGSSENIDLMGGLIEPENTAFCGRPVPATKDEIKYSFRDWDARIAKLVDLSVGCVKWTSTVTAVLEHWYHPSGRFVLVGDAAHAMTPYLAQGAAQCIEDAVTLGVLLSQATSHCQVSEALRVFQHVREPRCNKLKRISMQLRDVYCMYDGPEQRKRDHDLQHGEPAPGFIISWLDPEFQRWMYNYDASGDAYKAWAERKQM